MREENRGCITVFYPAKRNNTDDEKYSGLPSMLKVENYPPTLRPKKEEFLDFLCSEDCDILMAWYGGLAGTEHSSEELIQSLSKADWEAIEKCCDKKIVGRSDITFLLIPLMQRGIPCYYGPNYSSLADEQHTEETRKTTIEYLFKALYEKEDYIIDFSEKSISGNDGPWIIRTGSARGRLIGGNLDTLNTALEHNVFEFNCEPGDILFLEEVDPWYLEADIPESIFYKLKRLKNIGLFDKIGGIIIGKSKTPLVWDSKIGISGESVKNAAEEKYLRAALERVIDRDIPILANISCSHTVPMITLPLYKKVVLDANRAHIKVLSE